MSTDVLTITRNLRGCFAQFHHVLPVLSRLSDLMQQDCAGAEPDHLLLLGEAGVGKSRLLEYFVSLHPRSEAPDRTLVPVLYSEVPSDCTPKKLVTELLRSMGSEFWDKGSEQERTQQLLVLLKACGTRLVLLDEASHLVERGGTKSHYQLGDWVKLTARKARIPFVLAGTERARALLDVNEQLRSRFRETVVLQPFSMASRESTMHARSGLKVFSAMLGDVDRVDITSEQITRLIVFATHGRLREIRKLLVRWVELGFRKKSPSLTQKDLAQAFVEVIFPDAPQGRNPFLADFVRLPLTAAGEPYAPAGR